MKKSLILGMTVLTMSTLTLSGCGNQRASSNTAGSSKVSSVKKVSEKKETSLKKKSSEAASTSITVSASSSQNSDSATTSSHESSSHYTNLAEVKQQLIGKSFTITPTQFDGEDVDQAMDEQKAPQNTVHDGIGFINFDNDTTASSVMLGSVNVATNFYTISDHLIKVANYEIPYTLTNDSLNFNNWQTESGGHTITWTCKLDPGAKSKIDQIANNG
ncbi:hypothetical protein ACFQH1_01660 [Lactiplantibacillus daoliensis]|uniref:Lipoprotein n=1 Tax=Lactiplantibacillus daoliensis TaxID=2559916 RepID=A0ABW1UCT6_9LACO|nr:hypothetical protein [Lactiplantibacillus daoliensis]